MGIVVWAAARLVYGLHFVARDSASVERAQAVAPQRHGLGAVHSGHAGTGTPPALQTLPARLCRTLLQALGTSLRRLQNSGHAFLQADAHSPYPMGTTQAATSAAGRSCVARPRLAPAGRTPARPVQRPPLRMRRLVEPHQPATSAGRMVISGRMQDVCAELDRLAALEAAAQRQPH